MSSSPSVPFALDHISASPSEQLCYVHCSFCDTVLAVSVPCSSLFKTVAVRCGYCANLLSVNMRGLLGFDRALFAPTAFQEEVIFCPPPLLSVDQININIQSPVNNIPPQKKQRIPSAYNRFIKDEIQRIKAGNPDITHREAFSAAAKNWAHFPHIHFGMLHDQTLKMNSMRQRGKNATNKTDSKYLD